ncbi:MAG: hypothetical protein RL685_5369 [Pseudomonadota bacterium]|jgi:hypothetical protein
MSGSAEVYPQSERLLADLLEEFPSFCIVDKRQNAFSHAIDLALKLITLGAQRRYLTHYHTVIGYTLYVPPVWEHMSDLARVILLRHERVHLRQRRRYGFLLFAFLYLVPFLPLGLAYGRARLEWEAYQETLRATVELQGFGALADGRLREEIVRRFVGGDYGWMWPFPARVRSWIDQWLLELQRREAHSLHNKPGPAGSP